MTRIVFSMRLGPSVSLLTYLCLLHGVMALTVLAMPIYWLVRVTLFILCIASLWFYYHQHALQTSSYKLVKAERDDTGLWHLSYGNGELHLSLTLKRCIVISELVILYFEGQRFWHSPSSVWITADSADDELFRQLRVYCRDPKTFQK